MGRRLTASILAGIAAGLLCGLAQAQETKTLSWTPPTERVDGTALSADDLAGTRVLCEPGIDQLVPMPATSWAGVTPGTESCIVRAVDRDGLESADSVRVFPQWETEPGDDPPGAPTNVRVVAELQSGGGLVAEPVPIGDPVYVTASAPNGSANISVPADAELVLVHGHVWPNAGISSVSLGGQAFAVNQSIASAGDAASVFIAHRVNPLTGTRAFAWSWIDSSVTVGAIFGIQFFKSVDTSSPIRSADIQAQEGGGTPAVVTLTTEPDDYVSVMGSAEGIPAVSNLASLSTTSFNDLSARLAGAVVSGTSLTSSTSGANYHAASGIAVRGAPSGGGSTADAALETGSEAGAGFDARVVSRADISEATSAGSTHGAIGTIRAAITEGATAQQVAAGVASMAAQLAEATLAGAGVTARATVSEAITEPAGAGEAVSRQGSALAQVASSSEADAVLSAYLQAVAALAAGIEAGDSWAARLTAAATFSGAAEAGGEFAEDSVALIAAESQAGAQFAAAVHALAEQLEGATAGAAMAGIVSTLAAFSSASSAGAVFESAMRHADALQASAEAGAAFAGVTGELTGHLLSAVSAGMVVSSAHQARAAWTSTALAGASFVASGDVSALIGALAFVVAAEQRVFTVPAETRTFIVS